MLGGPMYDLAVIGGGPGGYVAAIRGAQKGLKVLLVEKDSLGGTCLNRGCVPTKCFFNDTKLLDAAKESRILTGTHSVGLELDRMVERKRNVVTTMVNGLGAIFKSHGINTIQGRGVILAPGRVQIHPNKGMVMEEQARHIILATGSRPSVPPFVEVDGRLVQTTDEALDPDSIPGHLIIIGGGVIGLEMATIYRTLGSEVTILEMLPDIIMTEDVDIRKTMRMLLEQRGIKVNLKTAVNEVMPKKKKVDVRYDDASGSSKTLTADRVLVATGRAPVLDGIDTEKLDLRKEEPFLKVNEYLETSLPGVYAIGDMIGGMMLAHKASAEAEAAVHNILGERRVINPSYIPRCIWGFTEIGSVGLTEQEARAKGYPIKIGKFMYMNSGAAQAMGDTDGFVKIVGDEETGEILGVHILGSHATDLIGEPVMAMTKESAVEDLAEAIKPHPTFSETVMEAAVDWIGLAIHSLKKQ